MVNGHWLMRDHQLLTLDEADLLTPAKEYARKIDAFLIEREQSVLSKLIAIGGAMEEESFEIQAKVPIDRCQAHPGRRSTSPDIKIIRASAITTNTTPTSPSTIQTRASCATARTISSTKKARSSNVRSRLTLIGAHEHHLPQVLLSRSRYFAPATHSLRFYREYFKPLRRSGNRKKTACATWSVTKRPNSSSTSTRSPAPAWVNSSKSKRAPGAARMPSEKPRWQKN